LSDLAGGIQWLSLGLIANINLPALGVEFFGVGALLTLLFLELVALSVLMQFGFSVILICLRGFSCAHHLVVGSSLDHRCSEWVRLIFTIFMVASLSYVAKYFWSGISP
jgi:hypothetical protein